MKYDLHLHTKHSGCAIIEPSILVKTVNKKDLAGIAITDHNTMKGAFEVRRLLRNGSQKNKDFDLILGEEIMTDRGEVLAYYINEEIRPGNILDVIDKIRQQGGIAGVSHPYSTGVIRKNARYDIDEKETKEVIRSLHAIETFNARTSTGANRQAAKLADAAKLAKTGGSDGHFLWEIGKGYTTAKNDLRKEILQKKTGTGGDNSLFWIGRIMSLPVKITKKII